MTVRRLFPLAGLLAASLLLVHNGPAAATDSLPPAPTLKVQLPTSDSLPPAPTLKIQASMVRTMPEMPAGQSRPFKREGDGHFYVTAMVNGAPVRFLVDTGATIVMLRREDAARAGLHLKQADFSSAASTAGGDIAIAPVRLQQVAVDAVKVANVEAAVDPGGLDVSLLGQSYLNRINGLTIERDVLTLR